MIIAFMGNDGSGKTTAIKLLKNKLLGRKIETIYVPGYEHFFLNCIKSYYQRITGRSIDKLQKEYDDALRSRTCRLFYLWPYFVFFDYICILSKYWFKKGKVILFDRYAYDYVISFKDLGIDTYLATSLFLALPKPKYCYVFDASAQIAYERKRDDHKGDVEYYRRQRRRYLWLAGKKAIPVINTDKTTPEEITEKIIGQLSQNCDWH